MPGSVGDGVMELVGVAVGVGVLLVGDVVLVGVGETGGVTGGVDVGVSDNVNVGVGVGVFITILIYAVNIENIF